MNTPQQPRINHESTESLQAEIKQPVITLSTLIESNESTIAETSKKLQEKIDELLILIMDW